MSQETFGARRMNDDGLCELLTAIKVAFKGPLGLGLRSCLVTECRVSRRELLLIPGAEISLLSMSALSIIL
jgi:hypothetical protein